MTRRQIVILSICVAVFALGQFHRASGSVFTPVLMARFHLSAATVGGLVSAMFFATILAQMPFGAALDRFGPRRVMSVCITLVAVGTLVFAAGDSFGMMMGARILIGVGLASMGAANYVIIARNFDKRDFGFVNGLVVSIGGVGGLLGTYPLSVALARLPWPLVFGAVALGTLALAAIVLRVTKRAPGAPEQPARGDGADVAQGGYLTLLRQREICKILALAVVTFAPITTITGLWGGPFLQDVTGLAAERAGAVLMLFFAATILGGLLFGQLDRRARSRRRVILVAAGVSSGSLILLAALDHPGLGLSIALLLSMIFAQQFYVPLGAHMRKVLPEGMIGRGSTLMLMFSVSMIPLMQIGFGAILDLCAEWGWEPVDQYRAAFAAMGVLIASCATLYSTSRDADG